MRLKEAASDVAAIQPFYC